MQHNLEVLEDAVGEKSMWMECVTNDELALKQLEDNDEEMLEVLEKYPEMYASAFPTTVSVEKVSSFP